MPTNHKKQNVPREPRKVCLAVSSEQAGGVKEGTRSERKYHREAATPSEHISHKQDIPDVDVLTTSPKKLPIALVAEYQPLATSV